MNFYSICAEITPKKNLNDQIIQPKSKLKTGTNLSARFCAAFSSSISSSQTSNLCFLFFSFSLMNCVFIALELLFWKRESLKFSRSFIRCGAPIDSRVFSPKDKKDKELLNEELLLIGPRYSRNKMERNENWRMTNEKKWLSTVEMKQFIDDILRT